MRATSTCLRRRPGWAGLGAAACLALAGCASAPTQPAAIETDLIAYNEAIAASAREQLLLNIVRLRYRDTIQFLQITGVTTSYGVTRGGEAGTAIGLDVGPFGETVGLGAQVERSVQPLVEYEPLAGTEYARQLLSPIAPESLFLLTQSGWSAERLLLCCVARIADLENARAAAGPTPEVAPDNAAFRALAADLRALQLEGRLLVEIYAEEDGPRAVLIIRGGGAAAERVRAQFGVGASPLSGETRLPISDRGGQGLTVRGRSMLGILAALSQTVDAPPGHADRLVTFANPSAWDQVMGGYFHVRASQQRPTDAAVAVRYRGAWFSIADDDLASKSTFDLVQHLFALQAARGDAGAPDPFIVLSPGR